MPFYVSRCTLFYYWCSLFVLCTSLLFLTFLLKPFSGFKLALIRRMVMAAEFSVWRHKVQLLIKRIPNDCVLEIISILRILIDMHLVQLGTRHSADAYSRRSYRGSNVSMNE
ncbi:hypothetical protein VNO77_41191 [Canavalia gladiata]|uniref:Uncharacterized protein n=1 Tax=Canavalia gladiata TaxID=3824 RepID=A0AAN9PRH3_CANGL